VSANVRDGYWPTAIIRTRAPRWLINQPGPCGSGSTGWVSWGFRAGGGGHAAGVALVVTPLDAVQAMREALPKV